MSEQVTLLVSFPDQSHSFVHGYEAGALGYRMSVLQEPELDLGFEAGFPVHTANVELMARLAAVHGYAMETEPAEYPEYTKVRLRRQHNPRPKLSVVPPWRKNDQDS